MKKINCELRIRNTTNAQNAWEFRTSFRLLCNKTTQNWRIPQLNIADLIVSRFVGVLFIVDDVP